VFELDLSHVQVATEAPMFVLSDPMRRGADRSRPSQPGDDLKK
jgi:hypothetical protein